MAGKNFAAIYSGNNESSALNQMFFVKVETVRGTLVAPIATDFLFTLGGGAVNFSQPFESSPHRSGRHNNNVIKQKTTTEWSLSTLINIEQGVAYGASIDTPVKLLWKALLGNETDVAALIYDAKVDPSVTFSIFENLDHMAKQACGAFVNQCEASFPGDGMSQLNWSGNAKTVVHAGIGKSVTANAANTITLALGEGKRFQPNAKVMVVKANGTTRSSDTPTARTIVSITGDDVLLDGVALTDSDGSVALTPVYLCYWEPTSISGKDFPQTGLVGSISIDNLPTLSCVRSATITMNNNLEVVDYCYGTDALSGALFIPGGRLDVTVSLEMNLNAPLVEFMQLVREFEAHDIQLICGPVANRHITIDLPRVIFNVPAISVPDTGSVPVTFEGTALQSVLDAGDEVSVSYS